MSNPPKNWLDLCYDGYGKATDNAYTVITQNLLADAGFRLHGTTIADILGPERRVVLFNWFSPATGPVVDSVVKPFIRLLFLLAIGKRLVFVHHNHVPHDTAHPSLARLLQRVCYSTAWRVITHNKIDNAGLRRRFGSKVRLVPHPTYEGYYGPREVVRRRSDTVTVAFFGQLRPYKNLELLISAVRQSGDLPIKLNIVGSCSSSEYLARLQELVVGDPRIKLNEGFVPDLQIPVVLASADLVVLPYALDSVSNSGAALLAASYGALVGLPSINAVAEWPLPSELLYTYKDDKDHELALVRMLQWVSQQSRESLMRLGQGLLDHTRRENCWLSVTDCWSQALSRTP